MFAEFLDAFQDIDDPRRDTNNKLHAFGDILFIAVSAIVSGMTDWVGIEDFAVEKEAWLRRFLRLENGIPSHDTLSRVIGRIPPKAFAECFAQWMQRILPTLHDKHVAIDGKTLRGSDHDSTGATHLLSAFASDRQWVLAQHGVQGKGKEIAGIGELLKLLHLEGSVVTIDAIGAQKSIVDEIVARKAEYVISLKENQPTLFRDLADHLDSLIEQEAVSVLETHERGHGRTEHRRAWLSAVPAWFSASNTSWANLCSIGAVECARTVKGKTTTERRYFISSIGDRDRFAAVARAHWQIENGQHWVLDVQFDEDDHRSWKDWRAPNLALIRRIGMNLHRREADAKRSIRSRMRAACMNDEKREIVLFGGAPL